jgi:hypothetical protein
MSFHDLHVQFWQDILARPSGPLAFRFILQPVMAIFLAVRDGWKDARTQRQPYLWTVLRDPAHRMTRLREGIMAVSRVLLLGVGMDLIYQVVRLHAFRPLEMVVIAVGLAFVPYLIVRGPAARIGRHILRKRAREAARADGKTNFASRPNTRMSDEQVTHH